MLSTGGELSNLLSQRCFFEICENSVSVYALKEDKGHTVKV